MKAFPRLHAVCIGLTNDKPTWMGKYQIQARGPWFIARSNYGVIRYMSEAEALAGAKVCQEAELARYTEDSK